MNISYNRDYLSIRKFDSFNLNNFSILTGLNGSGKTQLLQAINEGSVQIEGIDQSETIYFNNQEFIVTDNSNQNQEALSKAQNRIGKFVSIREELYYATLTAIDEFIKDNQLKGGLKLYEQVLLNQMRTKNFHFESNYPENNFNSYDTIKNVVNNSGQLARNQKLFTKPFYQLLDTYFRHNVTNPFVKYQDLKKSYSELISSLELIINKNDPILLQYFRNNFPDKSPLEVLDGDFSTIHIALSKIIEEEKQFLFDEANKKLWIMDIHEGKLTPAEVQEQSKLYANSVSPFELVNQVLNEFDCNGYQIDLSDHRVKVGMTLESFKLKVRLKHKVNNHVIEFSHLSSGEKTLMALVFLMFQAGRQKHLPKVLLLDEIDASLHPSILKKLFDVITNIFIAKYKMNVILATHSPTTIALAPEDSIYLVHKNQEKIVTKECKRDAISKLTEGFATLESGLKLFDQISKTKISIISEGNNIEYIKKANAFFGSADIEVIENIQGMTGKNQLNTLFQFMGKVSHETKVFFVWDCDVTTRGLVSINNTHPYIFEKNKSNDFVEDGIENLFDKKLFTKEFYSSSKKKDGGENSNLDKAKFQKFILEKNDVSDFNLFKPLFEFIKSK